ncbi:MAG: YitT family protein [Kiritimatiellae bacterium]|nr:YitT family protein [Kiritimatiellia bacterium]MBR4476016.1 YitT family protein [Kiritimatiellia bacterium]
MKSKSQIKAEVFKYLVLTFASLVMALDYRTFVEWGNLYPGGAVGMAMLVQRVMQSICDSIGWHVMVPFSPINVALNAIPVWIGFKYIGRKFTLQSLYVIFMSGFLADLVPVGAIESVIPAADLARLQSDPFLTSLFGGIVFGFGIALSLRCNATSGGTDFIAIYLSEKKGRETWNLILAFNAVVLLLGGFMSGWTSALYSIIYQFVYIQVVHLMYRTYQYQTLIIITTKPKKVCEAIYRISHHGATVIDGRGAFKGEAKSVVMSVVAADDTSHIYALCKSIDADAFINTISTSRVIGRFYLRPRD